MSTGTRFVLGTAQWGERYGIANSGGAPTDSELTRMLAQAETYGAKTIDTARAYGRAEQRIGEHLGGDPSWRIVTKVCPDIWTPDLDRAEAISRLHHSFEESIECLSGTPIDTLLFHRSDHAHVLDGALWEVLRQLRADGLVTSVGVSVLSPHEAAQALELEGLDAIQVPSSVIDQRLRTTKFFDEAANRSVEVFVRSVYLQGAVFVEELPASLQSLANVAQELRRWCARNGRDLAESMLAFVRDIHPSLKVIVGCETPQQLRANMAAWNSEELRPEQREELSELIPALSDHVLDPWRWPT